MQLNDLLQCSVDVCIQYFDVDKTTLMHEKTAQGIVHFVDAEQGITVAINGDQQNLFKVPPLLEACVLQLDGSYKIHWVVYRTQTEREDGQHEWWDWKPKI